MSTATWSAADAPTAPTPSVAVAEQTGPEAASTGQVSTGQVGPETTIETPAVATPSSDGTASSGSVGETTLAPAATTAATGLAPAAGWGAAGSAATEPTDAVQGPPTPAAARSAAEALPQTRVMALAARAPQLVNPIDPAGVTVVNLTHPGGPTQQYDTVEITIPITSAKVPSSLMPLQDGDHFFLNFPSELLIFAGTFQIENQDGTNVASCVVDGGPGGPSGTGTSDVRCTFNPAISSFSSFQGQMRIGAQLGQASTGGDWTVSVNGDATFTVTPPDGGVVIGTDEPPVTHLTKRGWFEYSAADPTVMLWQVTLPATPGAVGPINIADTIDTTKSDHYLLTAGTYVPELRIRDAIPNATVSNWYEAGDSGCPWTFSPAADLKGFTAVIPAACYNSNYYYTLYYYTKVTDTNALVDGQTFGNSIVAGGVTTSGETGFYHYANGLINGPGYGGVAVRKEALTGPGAGGIPADTTYSVTASWTEGGVAKSSIMKVTAGGVQEAVNGIPQGTQVTLSELTPASINGSSWGDPVFASTNANVTVSADKKSAVIVVGNQTIVGVLVTNTAYGPPSIDIEKWSTNESGPVYAATGALTNDGYTGDHDGSNIKILDPKAPEKITFTVSNNGVDDLQDIVVTDQATSGPALTGIDCTFPDGTTGTTWVGPFAIGTQFTCTGLLPALGEGVIHADTATVVGVGVHSGTEVNDSDVWSGKTPDQTPPPMTPPPPAAPPTSTPPPLAYTGPSAGAMIPLAALALLSGAVLMVVGRRRTRAE